MGDRLRAGIPYRVVTNQLGQLSLAFDLRRTSDLRNILTKNAMLLLGTIHLQYRRDNVRKLAYDIPKRNFSTL